MVKPTELANTTNRIVIQKFEPSDSTRVGLEFIKEQASALFLYSLATATQRINSISVSAELISDVELVSIVSIFVLEINPIFNDKINPK